MCRKKRKSYTTMQRQVLGAKQLCTRVIMGIADKGISLIHWLILAVNIYCLSYYCVPKSTWYWCRRMTQPLLSCPPDLGVMGRVSGRREKTHIKAEENSVRYKTLMKRQFGAILGWMARKDPFAGLHFKCNLKLEPSQQNTVRGPP